MDKAILERSTFGEWLRMQREARDWPLRKVAALLDIDTSIVSKLERGQRQPQREYVEKLALIFGEDAGALLVLYLADRVAYELAPEGCSDEVLQAAEAKIKYLRAKNAKQGELEF
ncbi:MAG: XRE family transcriptional regulator [Cytophagales bacterium]|nr:MAG: XRE family transcriptional regulator [Cytophagales bacterium]